MPLMKSWLESANDPDCPFPLNNLPYGVFSLPGKDPRCGVAIGDRILDLTAMEKAVSILMRRSYWCRLCIAPVEAACLALPAFADAVPEAQPDAG